MNPTSSRRLLTIYVVAWCLAATNSFGEDWPTYRHDNARTGASLESLPNAISLQWVYQPIHPPEPAWPGVETRPREGFYLQPRVRFDDAFQVAVAGGRLYFGSSADHKVYALDAASGQPVWTFFAEGPVRLAPTVWNGRVYFGSDDGWVCCLNAASGELRWKLRGGPNAEKLLGHGKMISRWPVRTGGPGGGWDGVLWRRDFPA